MRDTMPKAARLMKELWLGLPDERRIVLAAEMFDTARVLVLASFPDGLSPAETRRRLCARLYGKDLAARCAAALEAHAR